MDEIKLRKGLEGQEGLREEILKEMAEALGNTGERLERALERLARCEEMIRSLIKGVEGEKDPRKKASLRQKALKEAERYKALRKEAVEAYRFLIIHREAVGFRNHKMVHEKFQIPPLIRLPWP